MENKDQNTENIDFKELISLLNQIKVLKDQRKALEKAISEKRKEKFNEMIAESESIYQGKKAELNRLKEMYRTALEEAKNTYIKCKEEIREEKNQYESDLVGYEGDLAELKAKLKSLKKEPSVKVYEEMYKKNHKEKMRLIKKLDKTNDVDEKKVLNAELENIDENLKRSRETFYKTDMGKSYKEIEDKQLGAISGIYSAKKSISEARKDDENLDSDYEDLIKKIENSKKEKMGMVKANRFQLFIGGIRAKLGIGRHSEEKNARDMLIPVIGVVNNFINNINEKGKKTINSVKDVADKGIGKVKTFARNRESDVIRKLTQLAKDNVEKQTRKNEKLKEENPGLGLEEK